MPGGLERPEPTDHFGTKRPRWPSIQPDDIEPAVPYGSNSLPSSIDPTTGGPLPANFLRPYRGYGDILLSEFAGFSDYHALQTS